MRKLDSDKFWWKLELQTSYIANKTQKGMGALEFLSSSKDDLTILFVSVYLRNWKPLSTKNLMHKYSWKHHLIETKVKTTPKVYQLMNE